MAGSYEHSKAFDVLKTIKEAIDTNYTSLQLLQTLDHFLWSALKPIATECPEFFKSYLCKVVARQSLKASAKFTSSERHLLPVLLFNVLAAKTEDKAFEASQALHLNRGPLLGLVSFFLGRLAYYKDLHQSMHRRLSPIEVRSICNRIEQSMGLRSGGALYPALMEIQFWDTKARWWKELIIQKYTRMAILQAQRTYTDYNKVVKLDDVVQIYLLVVSRAIDRCDSRHGVLTVFIQNWFKSAKGEVAKMAEGQQDSSYDSLIEEHGDAIHDILGVSMPDFSAETWEHIAYECKVADPEGLVRTAMHVPQHVSLAHRKLLLEFVDEST